MISNGRKRVIIENVIPKIDNGRFPIKRTVGEKVRVLADIFTDSHDQARASLLCRTNANSWQEVPMRFIGTDRYEAIFTINEMVDHFYTLRAWVDHYFTWLIDTKKKLKAGQDIRIDILVGQELIKKSLQKITNSDEAEWLKAQLAAIEKENLPQKALELATNYKLIELLGRFPDKDVISDYPELKVTVGPSQALFSAWYEIFPRSMSPDPNRPGNFQDCENYLSELSKMGFDILYFPPIHPIGKSERKGRDNLPASSPEDPGSPWAIGSELGGHKTIDPSLGTFEDFTRLVKKAKENNIDIALDLAFQCSPDHPYVREHPEWFKWRPDKTIQYAENPPKKYEDIIPFDFECENYLKLWEELKSIVQFWIEAGVRIFRVDNPHTKPFVFFEWLIEQIKKDFPNVLFLSEAFTRPKVMYHLAKIGFDQSYTYFTWRNTKAEIIQYLTELTRSELRNYFRPNFWTNTPDILPEFLQYGGRPAFIIRLILAATLSSSYGVFGPIFELCVGEALPEKEEYKESEKYEIRHWELNRPDSLRPLMSKLNTIRRENPALQTTWNLKFHEVDNDYLLFYSKTTPDHSNIILVVVNLDPHHKQSGWIRVPLDELEIDQNSSYLANDLITGEKLLWQGARNYVELDPQVMPVHILSIQKKTRRESDFDYYM